MADDKPGKPRRAVALVAGPNSVDRIPEREANRRLLAAGYTMLDKAGRALGVDATELGESIDLAAMIGALEPFADLEVATWFEAGGEWWDKQTETMHKIPHELSALLIPAIRAARAQLAKLPKPAQP